jgi:hypothetical protein
MLYNAHVPRLVRGIYEISGYRGQAAVRRHFRGFSEMNCQQSLDNRFKLDFSGEALKEDFYFEGELDTTSKGLLDTYKAKESNCFFKTSAPSVSVEEKVIKVLPMWTHYE